MPVKLADMGPSHANVPTTRKMPRRCRIQQRQSRSTLRTALLLLDSWNSPRSQSLNNNAEGLRPRSAYVNPRDIPRTSSSASKDVPTASRSRTITGAGFYFIAFRLLTDGRQQRRTAAPALGLRFFIIGNVIHTFFFFLLFFGSYRWWIVAAFHHQKRIRKAYVLAVRRHRRPST